MAIDNINITATENTLSNGDIEFEEHIALYPNPVASKLTIALHDGIVTERLQVTIHDMNGRVVYDGVKNLNSNTIEINEVNSFSPSVYFITINNNGSIAKLKFVKE